MNILTGAITPIPLPTAGVAVQVTNKDEHAVEGIPVEFMIIQGVGTLEDTVGITDPEGIAEIRLHAGSEVGLLTIRAQVDADDPCDQFGVACLSVDFSASVIADPGSHEDAQQVAQSVWAAVAQSFRSADLAVLFSGEDQIIEGIQGRAILSISTLTFEQYSLDDNVVIDGQLTQAGLTPILLTGELDISGSQQGKALVDMTLDLSEGVENMTLGGTISFNGVVIEIESDDSAATGTPITAENAAVVQGQIQATAFGVIGKGPGKHDGAHSGTVDISISISKAAQDVNFAMVFDNFSDDGQLWLDGTVSYTQSGANFSYNADLEISGTYSGNVEGSVSVQGGVASGSWTLADGTTVHF